MRPLLLTLLLLGISFTSLAQGQPERLKQFNLESGLAIQGYDPVAYFISNKAVKGNQQISLSIQGVIYYFASEMNRTLFSKNYLKYEPQYGGWCAFAMGEYGKKVEVDPETFKILDGKLYLFYNAYFNNTLKSWNQNEARLKMNADKNWSNFLNNKQ